MAKTLGNNQLDERWNRFTGNMGKVLRDVAEHIIIGFTECTDTRLK